jgi:hypothetical protein
MQENASGFDPLCAAVEGKRIKADPRSFRLPLTQSHPVFFL